MATGREHIENMRAGKRKFVRYKDAIDIYGIGLTLLKEMASEAHAIIRRGRMVLIDCEAFEKYLETYREW